MAGNTYAAVLILIMSVVTILLRALPFLIFNEKRKTPAYIVYLGEVLPPAIIGMLVVYCLKDISLVQKPFALPELISVVAVGALQAWKKNSLLSILGGTALYMVLVQAVF